MGADYTQDGIAPSTEIGKGGPRVKRSGAVAQFRNNADSAFARSQAADPTANDDLATKRYVDGVSKASVDLYDSAGGTSLALAPAFTAIPMAGTRQINTGTFTHSLANAHFTFVGANGTKVRVVGRITGVDGSGGGQTIRGRITVNTGAAFTEVTGSRAAAGLGPGQEGTLVVFAVLTLNNGDLVRIEGQATSPVGPASTVANSSGLEAYVL
jgi:hypothetical protein